MRNNIFIVLIGLVLSIGVNNSGYAQTYNGDANLYTQQDVDDFVIHGYTHITGRLYIATSQFTSDHINDISQLNTVQTVDGDLGVMGCHELTSLTGLDGITTVGRDVLIGKNDNLESLVGLGALTDVTRDVQIFENEELTSVDLGNLSTVGGLLFVSKNPSLITLDGLSLISSVRSIQVQFNDTLESLTPLTPLTGNIFDLKIDSNRSLTSLHGLHNITSVHYLKIKQNRGLENLNGLEGITKLDLVDIVKNSSLTTFNGLNNVDSISDLYVKENYVLTDYCSLITAVNNGIPEYFVSANGYNPSYHDMQLGNCTSGPLTLMETEGNITIIPNPTHGRFNLDVVHDEIKDIKILNTLGQIVYQVSGVEERKHYVELNVKSGTYFIEVYTNKHKQQAKVIMY